MDFLAVSSGSDVWAVLITYVYNCDHENSTTYSLKTLVTILPYKIYIGVSLNL